MDISKAKIFIFTHSLVYGAPQALRDYLIGKEVELLIFISHPLQTRGTNSSFEIIKRGKKIKTGMSRLRTGLPIANYFIEVALNIYWGMTKIKKVDLLVGVDPLNCLSGVILKKMGLVKKLIYYSIDFVPKRFTNPVLNYIYHQIDKICLSSSDETWNVSPRIAEGREKISGLKKAKYKNQKVVPIGVWTKKVKRLPFSKIKKHQLIFVGNLLEKQGVQIVLDAMSKIIKEIPDFHFLIVGGGEYESTLRQKVQKLHLNNSVTFTGWIKDRSKLDTIMSDSALAIAMYDKKKDTFTYYADPTKLKDYLSAGLPILLTDVPHNSQEINDMKCGMIIKYDEQSISKAVVSIMKDEKTLINYRKNATHYIKLFDWNNIFDKIFRNIK